MQHYFPGAFYQCLFVWFERESHAIGWNDASSFNAETMRLPPFVPLKMSDVKHSAPFGNALC